MGVWADTYAPQCLKELRESDSGEISKFESIAGACQQLNGDVPHLIIHGPSGAGKTLRARLLLTAIYGKGVVKNCRSDTILLESGKSEFTVFSSTIHTELNAADLGLRDRLVIQQVIKEVAGQASTASLISATHKCRVFMIHEAHRLSLNAQAALRRTMERYSHTSRIFLLTERLSNIIAPLRSRCICVAVAAPSASQMSAILNRTVKQAGATLSNPNIIASTSNFADGSLRRGLVMIEQSAQRGGTAPMILAWQKCVANIVRALLKSPTVSEALACRSEIHCNNVFNLEGQFFLENIARGLLRCATISFDKKTRLAEAAAYFSDTMAEGSRDLFHIEGFVAEAARIIAA